MIGSKNAAEGWASFAAALAAHGALALGIAASPGVSGAGGRQTTAIGLNLIDTAIIEAALEPRASQAEARHRDVDEHAGKRENSQPAPAQRERREEITAAIGARPQLTRPEQRARPEAYRPSKASRKGGAKARGVSTANRSSAPASASQGAINSYAGRVRARIARNHPRGMRSRGTAVVRFGISRAGSLRYVRLMSSSGVKSLDRAAVSAVRRASPYPAPPRGMSLRQLSFSIPFYFK